MNAIDYKIKKIVDKIYAVIVPDFYDRAMLFVRPQEFYESPHSKYRNKSFCIFEFMKWYSLQEDRFGAFTYADDWGGFNIPFDVAVECYKKCDMQTPYDTIFNIDILGSINDNGSYIIGIDDTDTGLYDHELAHALYHTNKEYKKEMLLNIKMLPDNMVDEINKHLKEIGYTSKVYDDEIQAYLSSYSLTSNYFNNVPKVALRHYRKLFSIIFKKYKKLHVSDFSL